MNFTETFLFWTIFTCPLYAILDDFSVFLTQKQNDSTFVQSIIGKELQAANIKVKDQAFQNIFTQYIGGGDSSSSSSTSNE